VNNGLAIADLVSVGARTSHCYEIKGDTDKVTRIIEQSKSYDFVFNKISLITTFAQHKKALDTIPPYWGLIMVSNTPKIKIRYFRKASSSPYFSKHKALFTLWRNELINILLMKNIVEKPIHNISRRELIDILCDNISSTEICKLVNNTLLIREQNYQKKEWFKSLLS
jgi:hypothetical protein